MSLNLDYYSETVSAEYVDTASKILSGYLIDRVKIAPGLILSPMSGVTNQAFRRLLLELNPRAIGLVVSEFISVEGLTRSSVRSYDMMRFSESERPYCIQLFGYDINRMVDGCLMAEDHGADLIDINSGCPAPKVVKKGGGCELMRQPEHLKEMVRAVKKVLKVPLTVKFRAGWCDSSRNALEIAKMLAGEGVDAIAVHGRTRAESYRGLADWDLIKEIKSAVSIPVSGSGDVVDLPSCLTRLQSGADGVHIGRRAISNPFVFSEIHLGLKNCQLNSAKYQIPLKMLPASETDAGSKREAMLIKMMLRYTELLEECFQGNRCVGPVKQLVSQSAKGFSWSKEICKLNTFKEQKELLNGLIS